jgi:RNA polymerase sigma-70 factor (ECF subfamily)
MAVIEGFEVWYEREHPKLLSSLTAIAGDASVGSEATDEAFVRAYERWASVQKMASPTGWTYRTGLHVAQRRFRRHDLEDRLLRRHAAGTDGSSPPHDWSAEVWDALGRLPRRERTAVVLFHVADLPTADIAQVMGVAPGTVASSLHSGRSRLARLLGEEMEVHRA